MHNYIPLPIVVGPAAAVPPVLVEHAVGEAHHLGEGVEPGMKDREEAENENHGGREHAVHNTKYKIPGVPGLFACLAEDGHTEANEYVVDIEKAAGNLHEIGKHVAPACVLCAWVVVAVEQRGAKEEIEVLRESGHHVVHTGVGLGLAVICQHTRRAFAQERVHLHNHAHLLTDNDQTGSRWNLVPTYNHKRYNSEHRLIEDIA